MSQLIKVLPKVWDVHITTGMTESQQSASGLHISLFTLNTMLLLIGLSLSPFGASSSILLLFIYLFLDQCHRRLHFSYFIINKFIFGTLD